MANTGKTILDLGLDRSHAAGTFVSPAAYEIGDLKPLDREVFGPVLHVVRFAGDRLAQGVRSPQRHRLWPDARPPHPDRVDGRGGARPIRVGNMYVNRNQIGAVVGAQPFGGEGLSGTGPKAGGPHYLQRFATERVMSVDTTASGGNAALMSMEPSGARLTASRRRVLR